MFSKRRAASGTFVSSVKKFLQGSNPGIKGMLCGNTAVSLWIHNPRSRDPEAPQRWSIDNGLGYRRVLRHDCHGRCLRILQRLLPKTPGRVLRESSRIVD